MEPLEPSQRCVWDGSSRSWFWSPSRSRANRPVLRLFQAVSPSTSFANLDLDLDQTSMDRPKKRPGSSSPPESHAGSRQSTSTEREVRSSPQAQSASALGRARKRQGHSCARELVTGSGEPTSTAREARPSPPAPSAAVLGKPLTRAILLNPTDVRWQIWTSLARIAKETLGHRVGLQWSPWIYDSTFDGGMEKLQILDSKHCASHIYH